MPVLVLLPLWLFIYILAMRPHEVEVTGALADGEEVYAQCSSCHGEAGQGGVGYQLTDGEVIKSFANIEEQVALRVHGSQGFDGQPYGQRPPHRRAATGRCRPSGRSSRRPRSSA